jgi:hypothetical protein
MKNCSERNSLEFRLAFYTRLFYESQYNLCFMGEGGGGATKRRRRNVRPRNYLAHDHDRDTRMHLLLATCTKFCTNILVMPKECGSLVDAPPPPLKESDGVKQTSVRYSFIIYIYVCTHTRR